MKPLVVLPAIGLGLAGVATAIGGAGAGVGGLLAVAAQTGAVALLRPVMAAPQPEFQARWLGGMGIRALTLGLLLVVSVTHRAALPPLPTTLGYLGVLLPLLFTETRFLR